MYVAANHIQSDKEIFNWAFFLILAISLIALIPRLGSGYQPENYLWGEDGKVFITQANSMGLSSFWTTHAGYFHTYPRLFSLFASFFDLTHQPAILLGGWVLAYAIMISVLIISTKNYGLNPFSSLALCMLVVFQPNYGDVFFNITNSQWMIGTALTIYTLSLTHMKKTPSLLDYLLVTIACLTGPFSILIAPLLLLNGLINGNLRRYFLLYLIVFVCAFIQIGMMIYTKRLSAGLDTNIESWITAIRSLILFGANRHLTYFAGIVFWVVFAYVLIKPFKKAAEDTSHRRVALLFLSAAAVYSIAELYTGRSHPASEFPPGGGTRYNWIPNTLVFFSAMIAAKRSTIAQAVIIISLGIICITNFHKVVLTDYQFESYANFSKFHEVTIPINPQIPGGDCCNINAFGVNTQKHLSASIRKIDLDLNHFSSNGLTVTSISDGISVTSTTNDPYLSFGKPFICPSASDVGIEIDMLISEEGFVQLFWSDSNQATEDQSLRRVYPAGAVRAQFAFPNLKVETFLRLDPIEKPGEVEIKRISIFCLP